MYAYSEHLLIRRNSIFEEYGGLTSLVDSLFIGTVYLYIILVLGNCGGLKGLADKAVAD